MAPIAVDAVVPPPIRIEDGKDWNYAQNGSMKKPVYEQVRADFSKPNPKFSYEVVFTMTFKEKQDVRSFINSEAESLEAFEKYLCSEIERPGDGVIATILIESGKGRLVFYTSSDLKEKLPELLKNAPVTSIVKTSVKKDPKWTLFMDMVKKHSVPPKASL